MTSPRTEASFSPRKRSRCSLPASQPAYTRLLSRPRFQFFAVCLTANRPGGVSFFASSLTNERFAAADDGSLCGRLRPQSPVFMHQSSTFCTHRNSCSRRLKVNLGWRVQPFTEPPCGYYILMRWLQLRFDCSSTAVGARYDHSTTYFNNIGAPVQGCCTAA